MGIRTIPSLVVGLGGTGKRALTHLKRRIYDTYGVEELPWIRLLSIDADSAGVNNPPVISQRTGEFINLGNSEMRIIDQSDTPQVISHLDAPENRHILDWYPDPEQKVDFPKAARGSGQVRMFGRIGLYKGDNLHTTYRWLQQASHDVSDPASWESFPGFEVDPNLQFIYVICSLCGGTGSGMFLDIAYLLRKIAGVDPSTRRFMGMFVLPEVYEPVVENAHIKRIYANTYAALREMDYLMNHPKRSYQIRGKDHTFVDFPRDVTPFDFVFLYSNKNKRGNVISQRQVSGDKPVAVDDRVAQYISETIITDVLSPVTERSESILSNIFTSISEPETMGDRTFHKTYSAVGVASVKVPPIDFFKDLIELRLTDAVLDFLMRPDPDITEKALAKEFFAENVGKTEEQLILKHSLSSDPAYARYLSKPFREELKQNRQAQVHNLMQWVELITSDKIDEERCLESEQSALRAAKATLEKVKAAINSNLTKYAKDPERGYTFLKEWLEELIAQAKNKVAQIPAVTTSVGDPSRSLYEALESVKKVGMDFQLPLMRDTLSVMIDRAADFYDERGRDVRTRALIVWFYNEMIANFEKVHVNLAELVETLQKLNKDNEENFNRSVAALGDTTQERVLIDKPLVGRREVESFINGLLATLWEGHKWKDVVPQFSEATKRQVEQDLSPKLLEIQIDHNLDSDAKRESAAAAVRTYVQKNMFDKLFPMDSATGRRKEPSYTTPEGKSLLLDFAGENLMQMLVSHSTPLWFVQTHKLGSASQPITFIGLNGTKIPDNVVDNLKKHIPGFRTTDIVLSDVENRVVIKQYDPLYSLASMVSMADYENYYKNTDRKFNPMHTDIKFASEPNPYLQWLSYKSPIDEAAEMEAEARIAGERAEREARVSEKIAADRAAADKATAAAAERKATAERSILDRQTLEKAVAAERSTASNSALAAHKHADGKDCDIDHDKEPSGAGARGFKAAHDDHLHPCATGSVAVLDETTNGQIIPPRVVLEKITLSLCDRNPDVVKAWEAFFSRIGENARIEVSEGNILEKGVPAIIVPINSFGIMDSGLALALNKFMEGQLEEMVRTMIQKRYAGEMPVGSAEVLRINRDNPKLVIVSPTVRVPSNIMAVNVNPYVATRAALMTLARFLGREKQMQESVTTVGLAGMGTGGGKSAPATAAFQMYEAYCQIALGQEPNFATIEAASAHDQELKKNRFI
ncbi:MAG: hypothetical protein K2W95_25650 [Candidatus Obscuribacterales bacterium]|nr:hypothetical protein [Candidatus Obscuribacterales bacterium]